MIITSEAPAKLLFWLCWRCQASHRTLLLTGLDAAKLLFCVHRDSGFSGEGKGGVRHFLHGMQRVS